MNQPTTKSIPPWRDDLYQPITTSPRKKSRQLQIFLVLAVMMTLLGLFLGIFLWLRNIPRPLFLPIAVTSFESLAIQDFPTLKNDVNLILDHGLFTNVRKLPNDSKQGSVIREQLGELQQVRSPVVIYLAGKAIFNDEGKLLFLPGDADRDNPSSYLPFQQILELIQQCPSKKKLLIVDIAHEWIDATMGTLRADIAEAIPNEVQDVCKEDVLVLTSCSPGQVAWMNPTVNQSNFGYYVVRGLQGYADGFGIQGKRDGRVSVVELADFLRARVDRWAWTNRQARQTPELLGQGSDFDLHAYDQKHMEAEPSIPEIQQYPKWLASRWQLVAKNRQKFTAILMPFLFRYQQELLLQSERLWHAGKSVENIQNDDIAIFDRVQKEIETGFQIDYPTPQSFTLAVALDRDRVPGVEKQVEEFFRKLDNVGETNPKNVAAESDKLIKAFVAEVAKEPPFLVANAIYRQITNAITPTSAQLQQYINILNAIYPELQPRHVETLILKQIVQTQQQPFPRSADLVQEFLSVTRMGEDAASQFRSFRWNRKLLEAAAQSRHDASMRYWATSYVSPQETADYLQRAKKQYELVEANASILQQAQKISRQNVLFFTAYSAFLPHRLQDENTFLNAVATNTKILNTLQVPTDDPGTVSAIVKELQQLISTLDLQTSSLRAPLQSSAVEIAIARGLDVRATPQTLSEMYGLLATPFLLVDEREKLFNACLKLERRLHLATVAEDEADNESRENTVALPPFNYLLAERKIREAGNRQFQWNLAILALGDADPEVLTDLQQGFQNYLKNREANALWYPLQQQLKILWNKKLIRQYRNEPSPILRDRLVRIMPPLNGPPAGLNHKSDAVEVLMAEFRDLLIWLADRYRYESRDYSQSGLPIEITEPFARFYGQAFGVYRTYVTLPPEVYASVEHTPKLKLLTSKMPVANVQLQIRSFDLPPNNTTTVVGRILTPNPLWLDIAPAKATAETKSNMGIQSAELKFRLEMPRSADTLTTQTPAGALAEVTLKQRNFHHVIPVPLRSAANDLQIVLSPNTKNPDPPLASLRLRPGKVTEDFFVYVYNPAEDSKDVIVRLLLNGEAIKGAESKVTLPPQSSSPVAFPATPPAKDGLPPLTGTLAVEVIDAKSNDILKSQTIPVAVANPREYVAVDEILYDPPTAKNMGKNKFAVTLKSLSAVGGPGIPLTLNLDKNRIPGLLSIKEGNFKGLLKTKPGTVPDKQTLFAQEILVSPTQPRSGVVTIDVDQFPRCFSFQTTFAESGEPLTPRGLGQPDVRFRVQPYALNSPQFTITVETDNPPDGSKLIARLGRLNGKKFEADSTQDFPTAKKRFIGFGIGAKGSLQFQASIADWDVSFDTSQVLGKRALQAEIIDANGLVVAQSTQVVTFDNTAPEVARIVQLPAKAQKGTKLLVRAAAQDNGSGVSDVSFFLGRPDKDKIPPMTNVTPAAPVPGETGLWQAELALPKEPAGPLDITVKVTNAVGLSTFATASLELTDTDPATTGPGKISGKVTQGDVAQPGLVVYLYDDKNKYVAQTKTNKEGIYLFDNLKKGNYSLLCIKREALRRGSATAEVMPNQTTPADIILKLNG